ncbi:MAG TPA: gfo/Idh/MocA family oxidoreductase [Pirellulales bacterium]|jgi:predicted dehydrogenase|nr:gfo/Idh/MocA family oxidoreductase [Pirellulales bacterium]
MSNEKQQGQSRRAFLQNSGRVAAATALAGVVVPKVHAAEDNTIQIALIGCGGRGTGAISNAMSVTAAPVKLVAMADVFTDRLEASYNGLKPQFNDKIDVPEDRKFIGFDGYQKAMDCLKPGDIAVFTTPPAFRWVHFGYAIDKGLNVFMEKPTSVDGPSSRKMLKLADASIKKNLKVGVGLMCRHCKARKELFQRIKDGEIGDLQIIRAYRMAGPIVTCFTERKPADKVELPWQIQNFHSFLWLSGGIYSDSLVHNVDEACWMKDAWPVKAEAIGGRHYRGNYIDQNFDAYAVEYTFADGTKFYLDGRYIAGCKNDHATYAHGTKGIAVVSQAGHMPSKARTYKGQLIGGKNDKTTADNPNLIWAYGQNEPNPYELEWQDLVDAILHDTPYNEVQRGTEASLVTAMGRMAAHTGQEITYDDMFNCEHEFGPDLDKLTMSSPAPLLALADGSYPVPQPGLLANREY